MSNDCKNNIVVELPHIQCSMWQVRAVQYVLQTGGSTTRQQQYDQQSEALVLKHTLWRWLSSASCLTTC